MRPLQHLLLPLLWILIIAPPTQAADSGQTVVALRGTGRRSTLNKELCTNRVKGFLGTIKLSSEDYYRHPWAMAAAKLGYTTFLSEDQLSRLRPTR